MTNTNTNTVNTTYANKEEFFKKAEALGASEGKGALARPEFAIQAAIAAMEGVLGEGDAKDAWSKFRSGAAKKCEGGQVAPESSSPQRASELKQMILAACVPGLDFARTLTRAKPLIVQAKADKQVANTWDGFVMVARTQLKAEDHDLSDDEIEACLTKDANVKVKEEIAMLKAVAKSLEAVLKGKADSEKGPGRPAYVSDETEAALDSVNRRIALLELNVQIDKARTLGVRI